MCARCFISFFGKGVNLCTYTVRANALVPPTPIFAAEAGAQSPWIRSGSLPKVELTACREKACQDHAKTSVAPQRHTVARKV